MLSCKRCNRKYKTLLGIKDHYNEYPSHTPYKESETLEDDNDDEVKGINIDNIFNNDNNNYNDTDSSNNDMGGFGGGYFSGGGASESW